MFNKKKVNKELFIKRQRIPVSFSTGINHSVRYKTRNIKRRKLACAQRFLFAVPQNVLTLASSEEFFEEEVRPFILILLLFKQKTFLDS